MVWFVTPDESRVKVMLGTVCCGSSPATYGSGMVERWCADERKWVCVCVCVCVDGDVCAYVCVCVWVGMSVNLIVCRHICSVRCVLMFDCVFVCLRVCVCVWVGMSVNLIVCRHICSVLVCESQ